MTKIQNNHSNWLPYLIYLAVVFVAFDVLIIASYFQIINISLWSIPTGLRIFNILPVLLAVGGLMGLVPDGYLSKKKRANIFYFINSKSFKSFLWFWIFVPFVQAVFFFIGMISIELPTIVLALDVATFTASLVCFLITAILLLRLFYTQK